MPISKLNRLLYILVGRVDVCTRRTTAAKLFLTSEFTHFFLIPCRRRRHRCYCCCRCNNVKQCVRGQASVWSEFGHFVESGMLIAAEQMGERVNACARTGTEGMVDDAMEEVERNGFRLIFDAKTISMWGRG